MESKVYAIRLRNGYKNSARVEEGWKKGGAFYRKSRSDITLVAMPMCSNPKIPSGDLSSLLNSGTFLEKSSKKTPCPKDHLLLFYEKPLTNSG